MNETLNKYNKWLEERREKGLKTPNNPLFESGLGKIFYNPNKKDKYRLDSSYTRTDLPAQFEVSLENPKFGQSGAPFKKVNLDEAFELITGKKKL